MTHTRPYTPDFAAQGCARRRPLTDTMSIIYHPRTHCTRIYPVLHMLTLIHALVVSISLLHTASTFICSLHLITASVILHPGSCFPFEIYPHPIPYCTYTNPTICFISHIIYYIFLCHPHPSSASRFPSDRYTNPILVHANPTIYFISHIIHCILLTTTIMHIRQPLGVFVSEDIAREDGCFLSGMASSGSPRI
ncbi:hypothetical protein C8R44DRAFT_814038 [Mycena epipterygia]|nr:hypothetical protein C8R44DRAFT_814038 [Mycena epipterygia]